jgi:hypothetical protein
MAPKHRPWASLLQVRKIFDRLASMPRSPGDSPQSRDDLAYAKTVLTTRDVLESGRGEPPKALRGARFLQLCARVDRLVAGSRLRVVVVLIVLSGMGGPGLDWANSNRQPIATVLATNLLLVGLWLLWFAWIGSLRDDDGDYSGQLMGRRLKSLWIGFREHQADLGELEPRLRRANLGMYLVLVGCLLLATRNFGTLGAVIVGSADALGRVSAYLTGSGLVCCLLGAPLVVPVVLGGKRASAEQARNVRARIEALPILLEPGAESDRQFGDADPLGIILTALSRWHSRTRRHYDDAQAYREALVRHFRRHAGSFKCRSEVRIGKPPSEAVADLVLGDLVLILVTRGFAQTTAERVIEQMNALAKAWPGKPKLLVMFEAERREVLTSVAMSTLQGLHAAGEAMIVRM